jgi:hypothetical protein
MKRTASNTRPPPIRVTLKISGSLPEKEKLERLFCLFDLLLQKDEQEHEA